jgi:GNAT superfamily N-acetyltransferase
MTSSKDTAQKKYEIREVGQECLYTYARIPISFMVKSILRPKALESGLGGLKLVEEKVKPYEKDYDQLELEGAGPLAWSKQFDLRAWGFLMAFDGQRPVGGATIAMHTPAVHMLEGRNDLAVLWDLRVHPKRRGRGIGDLLFKRSLEWARGRGCQQMKIETQNINVGACRFYARMGCELGAIHRRAYHGSAELALEAMLLWYVDL